MAWEERRKEGEEQEGSERKRGKRGGKGSREGNQGPYVTMGPGTHHPCDLNTALAQRCLGTPQGCKNVITKDQGLFWCMKTTSIWTDC